MVLEKRHRDHRKPFWVMSSGRFYDTYNEAYEYCRTLDSIHGRLSTRIIKLNCESEDE